MEVSILSQPSSATSSPQAATASLPGQNQASWADEKLNVDQDRDAEDKNLQLTNVVVPNGNDVAAAAAAVVSTVQQLSVCPGTEKTGESDRKKDDRDEQQRRRDRLSLGCEGGVDDEGIVSTMATRVSTVIQAFYMSCSCQTQYKLVYLILNLL